MFNPPVTFTFDPFNTYTVPVNELPLELLYFVVNVVPVPGVFLTTFLTVILALFADTAPFVVAFFTHI